MSVLTVRCARVVGGELASPPPPRPTSAAASRSCCERATLGSAAAGSQSVKCWRQSPNNTEGRKGGLTGGRGEVNHRSEYRERGIERLLEALQRGHRARSAGASLLIIQGGDIDMYI